MAGLLITITDEDIKYNRELGGSDEWAISGLINDHFDNMKLGNGVFTAGELFKALNTYCYKVNDTKRIKYLKCYCEGK